MHYLIGRDAPRCSHSYQHRNKEGKDQCNGLIGQAWTIEALVKAYEYFEVEDCLGIAKEIFIAHPFSETMGLWNSLEPDGTVLPVDPSFNHQLWFCAAGTMVANHGSPVINGRTTRFLRCYTEAYGDLQRGPHWSRDEVSARPDKAERC